MPIEAATGVVAEGLGITGKALFTPTNLLLGHTLGGVLIAGGLIGGGIYFIGKGIRAASKQVFS